MVLKKDVENFRKIFSRLSENERKMPIVKINDKFLTWKDVFEEFIKKRSEIGRMAIKKLKRMGIL